MLKFMTKERIAWLLAIVSLLVLLGFKECKNDPAETTSEVNHYLTDTTKHETVKGIDVATIHQALLETQAQMKTLIAANDTLKKLVKEFKVVNSITKIKTETFVKDSIQYKDIPCDFKPIERVKETPEYRLALTISRSNTEVKMTVPNTIQFIEGKRKVGLFKTEQQVMAVNSNKLVQTTEIQSLTVKTKKKWWERPGPWIALGVTLDEVIRETIKQIAK